MGQKGQRGDQGLRVSLRRKEKFYKSYFEREMQGPEGPKGKVGWAGPPGYPVRRRNVTFIVVSV